MSFLETLAGQVKGAFTGGGGPRAPLARTFASPWASAMDGGAPPFDYERAVRAGYVDNPIVQRAVRTVSEGVGSAPINCSEPQLAALLAASSAGQSLVETLAAHLLLHGNAYIQVVKDGAGHPVELFALRPDRMSVVAGDDGWPVAYDYRIAGRSIRIELEDDAGWPQIVQLKSFHPVDDHYGAGSLAAASQALAIHNAASRWNRALLDNAARPSGALVFGAKDGDSLTTEQFERLKAELVAAYQGHVNAGRPMLLEGGLSWQSMSMSPADMDFAALKAAAARDIALAFGVPPMLLGLPGDNTYANYREANRALWRLTLLPLAAKIHSGIAQGLEPWFPGAELGIDRDRVPELGEDRERLWKQVASADFLTREEKRAMLGVGTDSPAESALENKS